MSASLRIHPGHGAGPFVVGTSRDALVAAVGPPDAVEVGSIAGQGYETWSYEELGVEVRFEDTDVDRASWIVVTDPRAELAGLRPIGMPEDELVAALRAHGIGPIVRADDFGAGLRDYEWPAANLSFWVTGGHVESVTVMPFYDETGDVPLWPSDARSGGAPT